MKNFVIVAASVMLLAISGAVFAQAGGSGAGSSHSNAAAGSSNVGHTASSSNKGQSNSKSSTATKSDNTSKGKSGVGQVCFSCGATNPNQ